MFEYTGEKSESHQSDSMPNNKISLLYKLLIVKILLLDQTEF